jgi:hypothetical protein
MYRFVFLVLFAFQLHAQDTIVYPKVDLYKRNIIEVSYGVPLGDLKDKYESSVNTAFYMRTKIGRKQFIDFGAEIGGIVKGKKVTYELGDEKILLEGSKTSFLLGLRYSRFLYISKKEHFCIESNTGLGWKYMHYRKPEDEKYKELDFEPSLNTINISQGLKVMVYGFGLHCSYGYAPYGLFNPKAERNFGGASLQYGLSGSWNF